MKEPYSIAIVVCLGAALVGFLAGAPASFGTLCVGLAFAMLLNKMFLKRGDHRRDEPAQVVAEEKAEK